ncbi:outer membrane beta-barrel family protein [Aureispira anguillae]|uniref:TonB-dependent receptor family protein n=1 Tax=Aureispira anguillae TaxID=2864201 RepID=A0A915YCT1_9BACT|nr:outer membrane beta-barrel family protein [Aureispira anguillae]BDS10718.1 TonB-dependent receptor family protein [Aureispira anguillae]
MKNIFYFVFCILFFLSSSTELWAQQNQLTITGIVVEQQSQQRIPFVTILAIHNQNQQILGGTTSAEDGSFEFQVATDSIHLEVSFIGFSTLKISDFQVNNAAIDLGKIELSEDNETLEEVVVRAEKSQTEFKLDKRVFNVGKDLSSTGASALEVLNNVPSVDVNLEGEISLRGKAGVQVLINGKPSILTNEQNNALGTITAEMIEKVEVITNPSAKYEAEGTSGIINIVMKKAEKKGLNGAISLNTGFPNNHSLGLSLNHRSKKFNFFSQLGVGYKTWPRKNDYINQNLADGSKILSNGDNFKHELFFNIALGADYYIDAHNTITLSGDFSYEFEQQPSLQHFSYLTHDSLISEWYREESTTATNPKWQFELQYKRDFKDHKEHDLIISALGSFFGKTLSSDFKNKITFGTTNDSYQQSQTAFRESEYTFKIDYTKPFGEHFKLEAGSQFVFFDTNNDYKVLDLIQNDWTVDSNQTNVFEYNQKVLGIYSIGAYKNDKWGIQIGLRMEYTNLNTKLVNTNQLNTQNYINLFPSAHVSYKVNQRFSLQAGYSRRINRPNLWDLNPFFNIRNNFMIRTGNPELRPEFSNSYEMNGIYILEKLSLNLGIYHLHTTDVMEQVSFFENDVNTSKPVNLGIDWSTGAELNLKYNPTKWMSINGNANYNYFIRQGSFDGTAFNFNAHRWSTKITAKFKLPWDIETEITGHYRSKYQTLQGQVGANIFADAGIRKKIKGGKMVVSFSVRDLFASRNRKVEVFQGDFYSYSFGQRGRFFRLGFSYGFGKGEAMEYSGRNI